MSTNAIKLTFSKESKKFIKRVQRLLTYLGTNQTQLEETVIQQLENPDEWEGEAIRVLSQQLIEKEGSEIQALLTIVSDKPKNQDLPLLENEDDVLKFVNALMQNGASTDSTENRKFSLHHAVKRDYRLVVGKLLDKYGAKTSSQGDDTDERVLRNALDEKDDTLAALTLQHIPKDKARNFFLPDNRVDKARFLLKEFLDNKMTDTTLAVLDCMTNIDESQKKVTLDCRLLESDSQGMNHNKQDGSKDTVFQMIAKSGNKDVKCHVLMRQLIKIKWNKYARKRFIIKFVCFLLSILVMTVAAVCGAMTSDPTLYDSPIDNLRAICEVGTLMMVLAKCASEGYQMYSGKLKYWKEIYNYIDLASLCCILAVVPLRWSNSSGQWLVFGVGYLIWTFRIFKYAVVTRKTGAYAQMLWQLVTRDFPQFTICFSVILMSFSGSFILVLRGENSLYVHDETKNFWKILLTGIRILIEGQPVVDYTGPDGYDAISAVFMAAFMFVSCVVLLNILIAQLSDTYKKVLRNAEREFVLNRIWIISRFEQNSMFNWLFKLVFKNDREIKPEELKESWNLDDWLRKVKKEKVYSKQTMEDSLESTQQEIIAIRDELSKLNKTLRDVQNHLEVNLRDRYSLQRGESASDS